MSASAIGTPVALRAPTRAASTAPSPPGVGTVQQLMTERGVGDIVVTVDHHDPEGVARLMLDRIDEYRHQTR